MEFSERGFIDDDKWQSLDSLLNRFADLTELSERIDLAVAGLVIGEGDGESEDSTRPHMMQTAEFGHHWKTRYSINPR